MSTKVLRENLKNAQKEEGRKYESSPQVFRTRPKLFRTTDALKYLLRFLPNWDSPLSAFHLRVFLHFGFYHPNFKNSGTFRCLGKGCPLCREYKIKEERGDGNAWMFKSTPNYLYYVLNQRSEFGFVRLAQKAHDKVQDAIDKRLASDVNPVDLDKGRVAQLILTKSVDKDGKKKNDWTCDFLSDVDEVSPANRKLLENAWAFEEIYEKNTVEELELIIQGKPIKLPDYRTNPPGSSAQKSSSQSSKQSEPPASHQSEQHNEPANDSRPAAGPVMRSGADSDDDDKSPEIPSSVTSSSKKDPEAREKLKAALQAKIKAKLNPEEKSN
jgi:hypothetical protein